MIPDYEPRCLDEDSDVFFRDSCLWYDLGAVWLMISKDCTDVWSVCGVLVS